MSSLDPQHLFRYLCILAQIDVWMDLWIVLIEDLKMRFSSWTFKCWIIIIDGWDSSFCYLLLPLWNDAIIYSTWGEWWAFALTHRAVQNYNQFSASNVTGLDVHLNGCSGNRRTLSPMYMKVNRYGHAFWQTTSFLVFYWRTCKSSSNVWQLS